MADTTNTKTTAAQAQQDARVLALKASGATWKFIALEMGWGWNGANMDGGRAKRAWLRATKAGVKAEEVKLPATLVKKLETAKAAKGKAPAAAKATTANAAPKTRTRKAATPAPKPEAGKRTSLKAMREAAEIPAQETVSA